MHTEFIAATNTADRAGTHSRVTPYRKRCKLLFDPKRREFIPLVGSAAVYPLFAARWDTFAARPPCDDGAER